MPEIIIKDVVYENIDDFINLCIPKDRRDRPHFIEGFKLKKKYTQKLLQRYGEVGKIAYIGDKPVGLIQYKPNIKELIIEIKCIFVPDKRYHRKGIGRKLLMATIKDMKKPKSYFNNKIPRALVVWAFNIPGYYPQQEFFSKMGFKRVNPNDPFLLYYPFEENYVYRSKEKKYVPQEEDKGMVLLFYDPECPFCIYFLEKKKQAIREIAPGIPIKCINISENPEEVEKRGVVSFCIVNRKPIRTFISDKERFKKEVLEALKGTMNT
mgnify:CR=1 FL=1